MKKTIFAVLAGVLAAGAAQAQTTSFADTAPNAYVGIGTGMVKDSITNDRKRTTKIFGGYDVDQNWGVEAGYSWLGSTGFYVQQGDHDLAYTRLKSSSFYAAAKYTMPLSERSSVYGKLGLAHSEQKYSSPLGSWNFKESNNGLYAAAGAQFKLTQKVSLYAELERNGESPRNGAKNLVLNGGLKFGF
ncbi:porin family protein [Massilia aerilata]|uniref:Porin family protein n=1 Tax=Massilia aerilata TaxID=453817 RepID=A0ABW0RYP9_9BURK